MLNEKELEKNNVSCGCGCESNEKECNCNEEHDHECGCGHDHHHDEDHECGCGCDHDHDHDHDEHIQTVTMENEDGTSEEYPIVDEFEIDGVVYVLVENPDGTVTPLRAEGEEGDLAFLTEEEFNEVSEAYKMLLDSEDEEDEE